MIRNQRSIEERPYAPPPRISRMRQFGTQSRLQGGIFIHGHTFPSCSVFHIPSCCNPLAGASSYNSVVAGTITGKVIINYWGVERDPTRDMNERFLRKSSYRL